MRTIIQHPDVVEWRERLDEAEAALVADALDHLIQDARASASRSSTRSRAAGTTT